MATSNVVELQRYLAGVLRYFASAAVSVSVVWAFDDNHDAFDTVVDVVSAPAALSPIWILLGLLGVLGLFTYFLHRVVFHGLASRLILAILGRGDRVPSALQLDFARWQRRGRGEGTPDRATQSALDEVNAGTHFLYCSGWGSLLVAGYLRIVAPSDLNLSWGFTAVVIGLLIAGFVSDFNAGRYDLEAYRRFNRDDA